MTVAAVILLALSGLACLVWTTRHVMLTRQGQHGFVLREDYLCQRPADDSTPFVSVVVAAKDEEENIERCVRTMLAQEYGDFEMIVANDRSADRTAEIVERLAREDPRVHLVNVTHLPEGWCGKNNAMRNGIAAAKGQWLCLIDADCQQTSLQTLRAAVGYALDNQADLLSVLPNLEMKGFWENVVQPVCGGVMIIWFPPDKVNDPQAPQAYANGAFMLIRRAAYERVGGHEAVKDRVNEDMHMAANVKAAGLRLCVVRNEGLYLVRMYTSLKAIVRGWSRIFFGTFGTLGRLSVSLAFLLVMGLLPYVAAGFGFAAAATANAATDSATTAAADSAANTATASAANAAPAATWLFLLCGLAGLAAVAGQISVIYRFRQLIGAPRRYAVTYGLGCAVASWAVILAMTKLRKGARINWRNTRYAPPTK